MEHGAQVQSKLPGALHEKTSCNSEKEKASHHQCSAISVLRCEAWIGRTGMRYNSMTGIFSDNMPFNSKGKG